MGNALAGRVVIVTNREWRRMRVGQILARAGYKVERATTQSDALDILMKGTDPSCTESKAILVDQDSLGPAALEIIRAVRNAELGIPTVVLTAFGRSDDVIACLRDGAVDYIHLADESPEVLEILTRVIAFPGVT
jgi:CheY-like chemotaxis protein